VIKMVEAMRHGVLPRSLHCHERSPHVDWTEGRVELLREPADWPAADERVRRAGVSSFGISGTNAHVIIEEPPAAQAAPVERAEPPALPLLVSGRGEPALRAQAERLRAWLAERPEAEPLDVASSLATDRAQLERRAAVVGAGRGALIAGLEALARGEPSAAVVAGEARPGKTAFVFTGQGAQWPGMGAELYRSFPAFAEALDAACAELDPQLGRPLEELLFAADGSAESELLGRTEFTQAALFCLEVALYRLFESWGVRPDFLVGHSIGELVAAHVAGVLSLEDACTLVAARGRLMGALPEGGAMLAVEASEDELAEALAELDGGVSLAAVNGPRALVLSGERAAIDAHAALWQERGRKTKHLAVSHAFHSLLIEPMLDEFRAVAERLDFAEPRIAVVSNLTGELVSDELRDPGYWVRHVREPVRFADGVRELERLGTTRFVELGPDGGLTAMARLSVGDDLGERGLFAAAMRAGRDQVEAIVACLGAVHASGAAVDWPAFFAGRGARRVELPTYAFQRERYWLAAADGAGDVTAAGLDRPAHPLLGASVHMAGADEWLFTGSWSLATHPWLADHAVFDTVIVPGTALAELALHVGAEVGCEEIEELTIEAPLVVPERGSVWLQAAAGEPDEDGRREIRIYSRARESGEDGAEVAEWVRHASGRLAVAPEQPGDAAAERLAGEEWPPAGAEPIGIDDLYDRLAEGGFGYGPAFQGVTAAWRRGDDVFAAVSLDEENADRAKQFGIHPALLDSAFHALLGLHAEEREAGKVPLPFSWSGVRLLRGGASSLRVALERTGPETLRITALDETGAPSLVVDTLVSRVLDAARLPSARGAGADSLFVVEWAEIPLAPPNGDRRRFAVLGGVHGIPADAERYEDVAALSAAIDAGGPVPDVVVAAGVPTGGATDSAAAVHEAVHHALALLQSWLADERLADTRLVVVTPGAVAIDDGEAPDLPAAAVWGLVRSGAAENPGRVLSIDVDDGDVPWLALLAAGEPQLALRSGRAYAPRFARAAAPAEEAPAPDPAGTVLISGGTGGLGALVARHLAEGGARRLLLASRRGPSAEGAGELVAELDALGCEATVSACDLGDRDAVARLLESIPGDRPLTAVIHTAGVMEDGTIPSLSPDRVDRVMRPKVDATLHLHELTKGLGLAEFVLFSSAAPLLGGAGQGNYAAANAVLDALAHLRRVQGLPARSLAWGLWGTASGMADAGEVDLERLMRTIRARLGLVAMSPEQGLELFDRARSIDAPLVAPAPLDSGVLRAQARAGTQPAVVRGLVRAVARRERSDGESLAGLLGGRPDGEWDAILLEMVRGHLAAVLGHDSADAVDPDRNMLEFGLDSLGAVELRNRISHSTGLRIPPTVAFDSPTAQALAAYLGERVREEPAGAAVAPAETNGDGGALTSLLREAHARGSLVDFVPVLAAASEFRPGFRSSDELEHPPSLVSLARGELPQLICVPSFLAGSGPHQFARLARAFGGGRSVSAFSLPGFRAGEPAPATWSATIDALAASVREAAANDPFVLVGNSIGGALAHALTRRLEDDGVLPAGLVMIDTYAPESPDELSAVFGDVMDTVLEEGHELIMESVNDENLIAMGTYIRLFGEFEPRPVEAPSLLVRASEGLGDAYEGGRLPSWQLPPDVVEVDGHHFGLIDESASATARVIDAWVSERRARSHD
jgi:pimaricinolide synthase PimS1